MVRRRLVKRVLLEGIEPYLGHYALGFKGLDKGGIDLLEGPDICLVIRVFRKRQINREAKALALADLVLETGARIYALAILMQLI